jgi:hypothetical protein
MKTSLRYRLAIILCVTFLASASLALSGYLVLTAR